MLQVLFAEGARGSCSEELMETFELREAAGADPQTYGLGVKEVWEIPEEKVAPRISIVCELTLGCGAVHSRVGDAHVRMAVAEVVE